MKRNIIKGMILISALALGSCSTTQLASNMKDKDDDVYFSNAKAGDEIEYVASTQPAVNQNRYNNYNDDDYYFYDSYASRINRFGYFSPFSYYNDIYYGYSPYSYYSPYSSWSIGLGFGGYYGGYYGYNPFFSPFGYNYYGYGFNPYYGYNYWGTGYAYGGGGGYWGTYSANASTGAARPYRAQMPNVPGAAGSRNYTNPRIGYHGNYPNTYMTRPMRTGDGSSQAARVNSTGSRGQSSTDYGRPQRPVVQDAPRQSYQPQPQSSSPPPSSMGSSGDGGRSAGSSGGGGGARPVRP